jgi:hypothetical protein
MKSLIKKLLRENLMNEIAINGNDLPSNVGLVNDISTLILFDFNTNKIIGIINAYDLTSDLYYIGSVAAEKGYGPLMYELAMTFVPSHNIISDRESVTDSALNIYKGMVKRGLLVKTLKPDDEFYHYFDDMTPEDNLILNSIFHYEDKSTFDKLMANGNRYLDKMKNKDEFVEELGLDSFDFFSDKLGGR